MKRSLVPLLVVALAGLVPPSADAFGGFLRNLGKRKAKEEAKRRAKQKVAEEVQEATGVDVGALATGDAAGMAKATLQDEVKQRAMGQIMGATGLPPELAQYEGMSKGQIQDMVKNQVYEEQGLTRFSPMMKRRRADAIAEERFPGIWSQIEKAQALKAAIGSGGVGGVSAALGAVGGGGSGDGSVEGFVAGHSAMERAVGSPTTTQDFIDGVADGSVSTGDPREAAIRAKVWAEMGTTPQAASRFQKIKAAAMISFEMKQAGIR